jgi:hypothetical protein
MKKAFSVLLLSAFAAGLLLGLNTNDVSAGAPTEVRGVISLDTTWTAQNSPYLFTGAVGIAEGITLTIEAGVTVNVNSHYMQVNGSLKVAGTPSQR